MLVLQVALQDVHLEADAASASILLVDGAFGMGSAPGQNILATFTEGAFIGATNGTVDINSRTLFDNTMSPFPLLAGDSYWLTAAIEVGAAGNPVPEPSSFLLTICGSIGWLFWKRLRVAFWARFVRDVRTPPVSSPFENWAHPAVVRTAPTKY
jgi:hypothetical protein